MSNLDIIKHSFEKTCNTISETFQNDILMMKVDAASKLLIQTFQNGGKVMLAGNGGSAADSQHICAEFVGRLNFDRKPLPAIALTTNTSNLTCIANDYGYDDIFSRQLEALANSNDTLIVYTTSGKSKNIINLVNKAKPMVSSIIALTGCYTQELEEQCDEILSVNSSQTTKIQEAHAIIGHVLCECVEEALFTK